MSLISLFDKGDKIAITRPGYPAYKNIINALDMHCYFINTKLESNFQLTPNLVKKLPKYIKGIIISSPSNPCGTIIPDQAMQEIIEICKVKNIQVLSDEIYHKVEYNRRKLNTAYMFNKDSIIINSFSKYFLMTGYRLGWVIGDKKFIKKIRNISMNFYLSPSSISQYIAEHVFDYYSYFDDIVLNYLNNRDLLIKTLNKIGLNDYIFPNGAFYLYVKISKIHSNSYEFCKKMVEDIGVTVAPGIDFDDIEGKKYIRISYSCKKKDLIKALRLIEKWI